MSFADNVVKVITKYGLSYLRGAGTMLLISLVGTAIGCLIGFIDEAEKLSEIVQNKLLKTLEEPLDDCLFII